MARKATGSGDSSKRIKAPTIVELVVERLRERIMSAEIAPGERLVEERLAEEYGVSRPPIREALRLLERYGLVVGEPRRGYAVVSIPTQDLREIESLRHALERFALEEAMPVEDPGELEAMVEALEDIDAANRSGSESDMLAANSAFHVALVDLAHHGRLSAMYRGIRVQIELCMVQNLRLRKELYGSREDVYQRHVDLYETIRRGNPSEALEALENHGSRTILDVKEPVAQTGLSQLDSAP